MRVRQVEKRSNAHKRLSKPSRFWAVLYRGKLVYVGARRSDARLMARFFDGTRVVAVDVTVRGAR